MDLLSRAVSPSPSASWLRPRCGCFWKVACSSPAGLPFGDERFRDEMKGKFRQISDEIRSDFIQGGFQSKYRGKKENIKSTVARR